LGKVKFVSNVSGGSLDDSGVLGHSRAVDWKNLSEESSRGQIDFVLLIIASLILGSRVSFHRVKSL
jgi:hypothetical protein